MSRHGERGSGTVLVVAAVAAVLLLGIAGLQVGAAASAAHRARAAADLSALAAASALQEGGADPCGRAAHLARRNSARVVDCLLRPDDSVLVRVTTDLDLAWPGLPRTAVASARAGPGDAGSSQP
ncbi:Rv3654c family TadE-like protein [Knoellia sp. CPCC 206450]|uniref:Rv3654c family TadE-like protein n=1 Tax=Knoellia tibetensis TaxID=3404798 RepID=UPI003B437885